MKKIFVCVTILCLLCGCTYALADIDLSGMSFAELVALKDKINLAIWNSSEWQEVTVPQGVWKVGEDIPAGTWTVKCAPGSSYMMKECDLEWGSRLASDEHSISWSSDRWDTVTIYNPNHSSYSEGQLTEYTFTVQDGDYIVIIDAYNRAVFTPYNGKPSLGFK